MAAKYHQGHDVKSLAINLATILLFFLPIALYFGERERYATYCGVVAGSLLLSLVVPPVGWMRPHPYTDIPGNKPLTFRKSD
mmetsp:Transcript_38896/g.93144  ORF Transcript_38896/g.93144 Transcript_38896/m.93144 type:complete len:82 (+) Transcript_38896:293-538(+)